MLASPSCSASTWPRSCSTSIGCAKVDADHLAADEIDAEVEAAVDGEGERRDGRDQRQHQREIAPAHEVEVGVVGDELEQLHAIEP